MTLLDFAFTDHDDLVEGERLRDAALSRLAESRPAIIRRLQRTAVQIALATGSVTADDVRHLVTIPASINPKINGSALNGLAGLGILTGGEYIRSARPVAHARPVRVWHLGDRDAALLWLATNPEFPDPTN